MNLFEKVKEFVTAFTEYEIKFGKKEKGNRFENWVVSHSNIFNEYADKTKPFWSLQHWSSDKYHNGYSAVSNKFPDLILKCVASESKIYNFNERIAVECKWRDKPSFFVNWESILSYEKFMNENSNVKELFYVFGFGWKNQKPEEIYLVPSKKFYTFDLEKKSVNFLNKSQNIHLFEKFKIKDVNKFIYKRYN